MKIVVIGGTGLIGSKTVDRLRRRGQEVLAASPNTGVNSLTGQGLKEALAGASVVIDLANSPTFEENAVLEFFQTSSRNLLQAGAQAGVKHHIALSIVGTERLQDSGYFRGKAAQEKLIRESPIPYSIVHSTQFFDFTGAIADSGTNGRTVRLPSAYYQPIFSNDVADAMTDVALGAPINGVLEIAGPDKIRMHESVARYLKKIGDTREVVGDPDALYFNIKIDDRSLVPGAKPRIGATKFEDWLAQYAKPVAA